MINMNYKIVSLSIFSFAAMQDSKNIVFSNDQNLDDYKNSIKNIFDVKIIK